MSKTIRIACKGAGVISIDLLTPVQDDFKILTQERYEELKTQINEEGFSSPIYVWEDPSDALIKILDGHQRYETLKRMEAEGYTIPQIPIVYVEADDIKQAIRKLAGFASQYGTVQDEGFARLMQKYEIQLEDIIRKTHIPGIDFNVIAEQFYLDVNTQIPKFELENNGEMVSSQGALPQSQIKQVQLFYSSEQHEKFSNYTQVLMDSYGDDNLSDLIFRLVDEAHSPKN